LRRLEYRRQQQDEAPELAGVEVVPIAAAQVFRSLPRMEGVRSNGS
jgi:hypothetical protein